MPRPALPPHDAGTTPASPIATNGRLSHRTAVSAAVPITPAMFLAEASVGRRAAVELASHVSVVRGDGRAPSRGPYEGMTFRLIVCGALIFAGLTISAAHTAEGYWQRQVRPTSSRPRADVVVDTVLLAASAPPPTKAEGRAGRRVPPQPSAEQSVTPQSITLPPPRQLMSDEAPSWHDDTRATEQPPSNHARTHFTAPRNGETTTLNRSTGRASETAWRERIGMNLNGTEQPVIGVDGEATGQRALQRMLVAMATPPTAESAEHRTGFHTPLKFGYRRRDGGGVRWVESPMLDVVVTYVNDTADGFAQSIAATAAAAKANVDATRFRDLGELRYLIRSLHRFGAGLIRRIVLVVADEGHVPKWINRTSTEIPFAFVTHADLFPDPVNQLPTFNSFSIETVLHRIPGLSEYFLYFNNDMLLGRRLSLLDLFRPVAGGSLADGAVDVETVLYTDGLDTAAPCELLDRSPSDTFVEIRCNSSERGHRRGRAWLSAAVHAHNKELVWNRLGVFPSHGFAHIFKLFHRPRLAFMVDDVFSVESRRTRESRFRRATDLWVTMVFAFFDHATRLMGYNSTVDNRASATGAHSVDGRETSQVVRYSIMSDALRAPECHSHSGGPPRIVDRESATVRLLHDGASLPLHMKQALVCPRLLGASVRCLPCADVTNAVRHDWARRRVFGRCMPRGQGTTTATTTQNGMAVIARLMSLTKPFENADFIDRLQFALMDEQTRGHPTNTSGFDVGARRVNNGSEPQSLCVRAVGPSEWSARYGLSVAFVTKLDDYANSGTTSNFVEERLFAPFFTTHGKSFYYFGIAEDTMALHWASFAIGENPGRLLSLTVNDDLRTAEESNVFQIAYAILAANLVGRERSPMEVA